ncbi:chorismate mutase [Candidatus Woesearchaeota archaeon]|nr:chorismate mutase [Candidatus Woesearchaeota archaeon]
MDGKDPLTRERNFINNIDDSIVKLLITRFELVESIKEIKQNLGLEIHQPKREQEILEKLKNNPHAEHLQEIFKKIMEEARKHQK